ncbi:MAG: hypothetical protein ACOH1I_11235 [Gallionellaceae bacterium]
MMRSLNFLALLLMSLLHLPGFAQAFSDPTRPPYALGNEAGSQVTSVKVKGLQSVLISHARCSAIIDGKSIPLGGMYGNEKLVEISENGVVLRGNHGLRELPLYPAVGMKTTAAQPQQIKALKCRMGMLMQEEMPAVIPGQKEKK